MQAAEGKRKFTGFELAALLFFASGFSSLIYQVVWNRLFVFAFGSTTFATASVLAVFMGGLAIGSFIAGKKTHLVQQPLLWYGILEGVIGAWALLVPTLIHASIPLYKAFHAGPESDVTLLAMQRFVLAAGSILLPTICMGATLPLLSKYVSNKAETIGFRVGTLYAINTCGAVFGAASGGFWLLPTLGLSKTIFVSAAINFLLLLAAVILSKSKFNQEESASETLSGPVSGTSSESTAASSADLSTLTPGADEAAPLSSTTPPPAKFGFATRVAIAVFGISGAISMVYEVGWTRALVFVIGSSTYAFTCMLTTFLIGIFLGSLYCARIIDRFKNPLLFLAILEAIVSAAALLGLILYNLLPITSLALTEVAAKSPDLALVLKFFIAALTFVPLTLGLGATFPAVVKACAPDLKTVGQSVGIVYSANTCGAIIGAFVAGFFLVPMLGVEKMLVYASLCNLILAVVLLFVCPGDAKRYRIPAVAVLVLTSFLAFLLPVWDKSVLLLCQPFRRIKADHAALAVGLLLPDVRKRILQDSEVLYFQDGISSNVGVIQHGNPPHRLILTNGNIDGGDKQDMVTQVLLGIFPYFCRPEASNVCVIGWGTGVTSGAAGIFPAKRIVSVEMERKVIEASKLFHHVNRKPDLDPRTQIVINDARNYLLLSDEKFDAVVSEPSNQWQAGVCNLFSKEFFGICKDRLKSEGVLAFWIQTTEIAPENVKGVIAAALASFKHILIVYAANQTDLVMLASNEPVKFDYAGLQKAYANPAIKTEMDRVGMPTVDSLLARVVASDTSAKALVEGVTPNSDDYNYLEYSVCKTYESARFNVDNFKLLAAHPLDPMEAVDFASLSGADLLDASSKIARAALEFKEYSVARSWADWTLQKAKDLHIESGQGVVLATAVLARCDANSGNVKLARELADRAVGMQADNPDALLSRGIVNGGGGVADLTKLTELEPSNPTARAYLAFALAGWNPESDYSVSYPDMTNPNKVWTVMSKMTPDEIVNLKFPNLSLLSAVAAYESKHVDSAVQVLKKAIDANSEAVTLRRLLGTIYWMQGKHLEASAVWQVSFLSSRLNAFQERDQAATLLSQGKFAEAFTAIRRSVYESPSDRESMRILSELSSKEAEAKTMKETVEGTAAYNDFAEDSAQAKRAADSQTFTQLISLLAAAYLLWMVLRKSRKNKE